MNKKIYFITQAKGGAGKSVLAFMLAEKYKEAVNLIWMTPRQLRSSNLLIGNRLRFHFLIRPPSESIEVLSTDSLKA